MISNIYANNILKALMGKGSFATPATIYIGLCANEPDRADGKLDLADEPTSIASYARERVATVTSGSNPSYSSIFGTPEGGVIKNVEEIKFNAAREKYPNKINYWFLSTSASGGSAYLWGRIKDVLMESQNVTDFVLDSTFISDSTICKANITTSTLINFDEGAQYIVSWDDVDYDVTATVYEKDGVSYFRLGNPLVSGGEEDDMPFGILYNNSIVGTDTLGNLTIYALDNKTSHSVAFYGIGITVRKATVPTFYENELQASLDAK